MAFIARARAAIRDSLLGAWQTRAAAIGRRLLTTRRTIFYLLADGLGVELEGLEAAAAAQVDEVFPNTASDAGVARHGGLYALPRRAASAAHLRLVATGPTSSSTAIPAGRVLTTPDGATFTPTAASITTNSAGAGEVDVVATTAGTAGNLPVGSVLTWSAAPTGFASTATVTEITTEGEDIETVASWAERIVERLQERPASGNRADWRAWAESVDGVGDVFVHCCAEPPNLTVAPARPDIVPNVLGCVSIVVTNPPPASGTYVQNADGTLGAGLDPTYSRRPTQALCDAVRAYIDGTGDVHGRATSSGRQLYPGDLDPDNWDAVRPAPVLVDVTVEVDPLIPGAFAFDTERTLTAVTDASHMTLSSAASIEAGAPGESGTQLAFWFTGVNGDGLPNVIRGAWALAAVDTVNAGTGAITLSTPLPVVPTVGMTVRAAPDFWDAIRRIVLEYFDSLGPGAPDGLARSTRWPAPTPSAPSRVVASRILVGVLAIPGVEDANISIVGTATEVAGRIKVPRVITVTKRA